jgi:hypothetical protein
MTPEFNYLIWPLAIIQLRCFFGAGESNLNKYTLAANSFVSDTAQRAKFKFIFHALTLFFHNNIDYTIPSLNKHYFPLPLLLEDMNLVSISVNRN